MNRGAQARLARPDLWDWFAAACAWVVLAAAVWAGSGIAARPEPDPRRAPLTAGWLTEPAPLDI